MKFFKMNIDKCFLTFVILIFSISGFSKTINDLTLNQNKKNSSKPVLERKVSEETKNGLNKKGISKANLPNWASSIEKKKKLAQLSIVTITANTDGTISIFGSADIGSTVTITFTDGTKGTFVTDATGKYGPIKSDKPQTNGNIKAISTDVAGNISQEISEPYIDTTSPLVPTIKEPITVNPSGTISIYGTAESGSKVTVAFPDGTFSPRFSVDALGNYGPITSGTPQTTGLIKVTAKDFDGNVSPEYSVRYVDVTKPISPTIKDPITVHADGTISVYGTAEIGSTVTITFADGTKGTFLAADSAGNFGPIKSVSPQTTGVIKVKTTDVAGNTSADGSFNYVDITKPLTAFIKVPITVNSDGTIALQGTAEIGSTVTIIFPDGTKVTNLADSVGNYGFINSGIPQISGSIKATATDVAGNISTEVSVTYFDNTSPLVPTITQPITANSNGTISVYGKAEAGSKVTLRFPDGTFSTGFSVDVAGNYGPIKSVLPQTTGVIKATAKDAEGNVSPEASVLYTDITKPLSPTIKEPVTVNSDGTITVYGTAEIGSTVVVTFPDGTQAKTVTNSSGNYGPLKSVNPQTSGLIKAKATDVAGNISPEASVNYIDVTKPLMPTIKEPITVHEDGKISIFGTAEIGSTVTITFPDGTKGTFVTDVLGNYGPVKSGAPQTSGIVKATATDVAGNISPEVSVNYIDSTKPLIPTITEPITVNTDGTLSIYGSSELGSKVTVTFADGSLSMPFLVDITGNYGPIKSGTPQTTGLIKARATDAAGNISPDASVNYIDVTKPLLPTIKEPITVNTDGTISIFGTAEIGSTVTITFPDGTKGTFVADALGNYGPVKSVRPQTTGLIKATATDSAGNISPDDSVNYIDVTKPLIPTIKVPITVNIDNSLTIFGTAEIGSTVIVVFPDGTKETFVTDMLGNYGPVKSANPQITGMIKVTAMDAAGNISPEVSVDFDDKTAPSAPKVNLPIKINENGIVELSGTAEPNSNVLVKFSDGTSQTTLVDINGNFGPIISKTPQSTGNIITVAIDRSNNSSEEVINNIIIGGIALIKIGVLNDINNDGYQQAGETITYSFSIKNIGNVSLTSVYIEDPLLGKLITGSPINLAIGETNSEEFKGVYTLKQTDINIGSVTNQATAIGTTPAGLKITDKSDDTSFLGDNPTVITTGGCVIEVFNGLTPGNDNTNDVFFIRGIECFPNNTLQIFNRWGVIVFDKTQYNNTDRGFRGISEGNLTLEKSVELPTGTYYYVLKYTDDASVSNEKIGYLYINK